jgi:isocitrate dehydrogenase
MPQCIITLGFPFNGSRKCRAAVAESRHPLPSGVGLNPQESGGSQGTGKPCGRGFTSVNVTLRKALIYTPTRPTLSLPGITSRYGPVDLVVVRENTRISTPVTKAW